MQKPDVSEFINELREKLNLDIVDSKIVYKTPLDGACMGPKRESKIQCLRDFAQIRKSGF